MPQISFHYSAILIEIRRCIAPKARWYPVDKTWIMPDADATAFQMAGSTALADKDMYQVIDLDGAQIRLGQPEAPPAAAKSVRLPGKCYAHIERRDIIIQSCGNYTWSPGVEVALRAIPSLSPDTMCNHDDNWPAFRGPERLLSAVQAALEAVVS
jgi:hypothetical protein